MAWSGTLPPTPSSLLGDDVDDLLFSAATARPQGGEQQRRRARRRRTGGGDGEGKKRRLSDAQARFLETCFGEEKKLELGRKVRLAAEAGLDPKQVAVWFQNRRARHKSKQVVDAYLELKSAHDAAVLQKFHLENEVLMLKAKLSEAEEKIRRLSPGVIGGGEMVGSPSSSSLTQQPLMADFEEAELLDCLQEFDLEQHFTDWGFPYGLYN